MSRKKIILITGSNGEIGQNLINHFSKLTSTPILSLDLQPSKDESNVYKHLVGSILDDAILDDINSDFEIEEIYHLAAMLSTKSEINPISAHNINVNGTLKLIDLAIKQAIMNNSPVKFFFPSSIAVYGNIKNTDISIKENEFLNPSTIYGMNKLYCEQLGVYFSKNYHHLTNDYKPDLLDFRSIRFPGIISITTRPTGGTSDYLPEMLHAANNKEKAYNCFVGPQTRLPFMIMPDAIDAIIKLMNTQKSYLRNSIYNISAFSPTVDEFYNKLSIFFKDFNIKYDINEERQKMVDGWPSEVDCSNALQDWNWKPKYNLDDSFREYFIPFLKSKEVSS